LLTHSLNETLAHSLTHSLTQRDTSSLTHSLTHSRAHTLAPLLPCSLSCWLIHAPINAVILQNDLHHAHAGLEAFGVGTPLGQPLELQLPLLQQVLGHMTNLLHHETECQHAGGTTYSRHTIAKGYSHYTQDSVFTEPCTWDPPPNLWQVLAVTDGKAEAGQVLSDAQQPQMGDSRQAADGHLLQLGLNVYSSHVAQATVRTESAQKIPADEAQDCQTRDTVGTVGTSVVRPAAVTASDDAPIEEEASASAEPAELLQEHWPTPTSAQWTAIATVTARLLAVLKWQRGSVQSDLVLESSSKHQSIAYMNRRTDLQTSLWQMLHGLLLGHVSNPVLDISGIFSMALKPVMNAWLFNMRSGIYSLDCVSKCPEIAQLGRAFLQRLAVDKKFLETCLTADNGASRVLDTPFASGIITMICKCCV